MFCLSLNSLLNYLTIGCLIAMINEYNKKCNFNDNIITNIQCNFIHRISRAITANEIQDIFFYEEKYHWEYIKEIYINSANDLKLLKLTRMSLANLEQPESINNFC